MIISVQIFLGKSICFNQRRVHKTLEHKKVPFVFSETFKMDVLSSNSMRCLLTLIPHSSRLQTFAYMTSFSRLKAWGELRKRVDGILKFWVGRPVSDGSPFWQEKWQGARLNLPSLGLARLFFPPPFPDAEHVRHLRLQHTICAAEDCGWASSLGRSKNTHRCKRIFIICGEILVADKQKPLCLWNLVTRRGFFFFTLGFLGTVGLLWGWLTVTSEVLKGISCYKIDMPLGPNKATNSSTV